MPDSDKKNTTSWQPGQSGNPSGRPSSSDSFAEALREVVTPEEKKELAKAMLKEGKAGNVPAAAFIRDTLDGKPAQRQIITGDPDAPVAVVAGPRKREKE